MHHKNCPHCNTAWEEKETIYEYFLEKYGDPIKARATAEMYGDTEEHPKHFGLDVVGIETDNYDGVSFWQCLKCGSTFDRWTMKKVSR